ncbi:MAG: hypothetical protein DRZ82_05065 [Thermoprotei archaeon]|nr:MAG: hypothetical protein DRZ82_05065 [Thermoprotei archaeon]
MNYIKIIIIAWIIYASFYLCRVNYPISIPFINSDLGITFTSLGLIASAFFASYSIGQVINGYLGVRYRPWRLLILGIVGSSITTLLFGFSASPSTFLILWLINGYFQSIGWPILVKVIATVLTHENMSKGYGIFNTSWALGHALSWLFTGLIIDHYGWRWGFIINGVIFPAVNIPLVLDLMRHISPLETAKSDINRHRDEFNCITSGKHVIALLILALVYLVMYAVRYALVMYLPSYVHHVERHISTFLLTIVLFPISGSLGMVSLGFLFNRVAMHKRIILMIIMNIAVAILLSIFPLCYEESRLLGLLILMLLSSLLYGLESQVVSTMPVTLIGRKYSSLAVGIIDSAGSIGAFISSLVSGMIIDSSGFNIMLRFWSYVEMILPALLLTLMLIIRRAPCLD